PARPPRPDSRLRGRARLPARTGLATGNREHSARSEARSKGTVGTGLRRRRAGPAPQDSRDNACLRPGETVGSRRRACRRRKISEAQQEENFALWQETIQVSGRPPPERMASATTRKSPNRKPR